MGNSIRNLDWHRHSLWYGADVTSWLSQQGKIILKKEIDECILICVRPFAIPWTVACQASLSMEFSREEYWSELPFPSLADLPNPGTEPVSPASPELAGGFFITVPPEINIHVSINTYKCIWKYVNLEISRNRNISVCSYQCCVNIKHDFIPGSPTLVHYHLDTSGLVPLLMCTFHNEKSGFPPSVFSLLNCLILV